MVLVTMLELGHWTRRLEQDHLCEAGTIILFRDVRISGTSLAVEHESKIA